jgi:hypothetical protein
VVRLVVPVVPEVGVVDDVDAVVWVEVEVPLVFVMVEVTMVVQLQLMKNNKKVAMMHPSGINPADICLLFFIQLRPYCYGVFKSVSKWWY